MRHLKSGRKFGRKSAPRQAMFSHLAAALIEHERIETTDTKAKALRPIVEKTISWATSVGHIMANENNSDAQDRARIVHAIRMARRVVRQPSTLNKLFHDLGPRLVGRPGGYTRILKYRTRAGDAAPMSIIELVDRIEPETSAGDTKTAAKATPAKKPAKETAEKPKKAESTKAVSAKGESKKAPSKATESDKKAKSSAKKKTGK